MIVPTDADLIAAKATLKAFPGADDASVNTYLADFALAIQSLQKKFPERVITKASTDATDVIVADII